MSNNNCIERNTPQRSCNWMCITCNHYHVATKYNSTDLEIALFSPVFDYFVQRFRQTSLCPVIEISGGFIQRNYAAVNAECLCQGQPYHQRTQHLRGEFMWANTFKAFQKLHLSSKLQALMHDWRLYWPFVLRYSDLACPVLYLLWSSPKSIDSYSFFYF